MKRILLILSPARVSASCIDGALRAAESGRAELVVVFVLDTSISDDFQARLRDMGFLGEVPSSQLIAAMREEQARQGREELARVEGLARGRGIGVRAEFIEGEFVTCSLAVAGRESADAIFVARRGRPALSRIVAGSAVNDLRDAASCRVLIHDAGDSDDGGE